MGTITRYMVEPFVAAYEQAHPHPHEITWLDTQALARKDAKAARIATPEQDAALLEMVQRVAEEMQTYPPKVIVYQGHKPNAVHINNNTLLIEERKVMQSSPEELAATLAHELSHQQQNTTALMVGIGRVMVDIGAGVMAATAWMQRKPPAIDDKLALAGAVAIGVGATAATHLATEPVVAAWRRGSELTADATSAKTCGAEPMKRVLEAKLVHPAKEKNLWQQLTATHPSHEERITALEKIEALEEKSR